MVFVYGLSWIFFSVSLFCMGLTCEDLFGGILVIFVTIKFLLSKIILSFSNLNGTPI